MEGNQFELLTRGSEFEGRNISIIPYEMLDSTNLYEENNSNSNSKVVMMEEIVLSDPFFVYSQWTKEAKRRGAVEMGITNEDCKRLQQRIYV